MTVKQEVPNSTFNSLDISFGENDASVSQDPMAPLIPPKQSKSSTGKRKYHQKSRNGCTTCKKRRVKCDEQKPVCGNCTKLKLDCGYLHVTSEDTENKTSELEGPQPKKRKRKSSLNLELPMSGTTTQQATPSITPSPEVAASKMNTPPLPQMNPLSALSSGLLSAGNLNNLNISHLVNNLSGLGDLSNLASLGNLASLSNLATLAQLPIDLSNLGALLDPLMANNLAANALGSSTSSAMLNNVNVQQDGFGLRKSLTVAEMQQTQQQHSVQAQTQGQPQMQRQQQQLQQQRQPQTEPQSTTIPMGTDPIQSNPSQPTLASQQELPGMNYPGCSTTSTATNPFVATTATAAAATSTTGASSSSSFSSMNTGAACTATDDTSGKSIPNISPNTSHSSNPLNNAIPNGVQSTLNMLDLKLMFHYTSQVANTITGAGISETNIWNHDIPLLAFEHPFLMHSILAFSATHLSRTEKGLDQCVTSHRGDALRLLREAVLNINADNTDALVASALILIMDS